MEGYVAAKTNNTVGSEFRMTIYRNKSFNLHTDENIIENNRLNLCRDGVIVVDTSDIHNFPSTDEFKTSIREFCEYKSDLGFDVERTLNDFCTFANPSSFHHQTIRNIRQLIHIPIQRKLWEYYEEQALKNFGIVDSDATTVRESETSTIKVTTDSDDNYPNVWQDVPEPDIMLEQIPDQVMWRVGTQPQQFEEWHRHTSQHALPGDVIFEGWINMDADGTDPQVFTCILTSQNLDANGADVSNISDDDNDNFNLLKCQINIPPKSIILFNSSILHMVPAKKNNPVLRQCIGFRLSTPTFEKIPLLNLISMDKKKDSNVRKRKREDDHIQRQIDANGVFYLKSGNVPAVVSPSILENDHEKIITFSNYFVDNVKTQQVTLTKLYRIDELIESTDDSVLKWVSLYSCKVFGICESITIAYSDEDEDELILKHIKEQTTMFMLSLSENRIYNTTEMYTVTQMRERVDSGAPNYCELYSESEFLDICESVQKVMLHVRDNKAIFPIKQIETADMLVRHVDNFSKRKEHLMNILLRKLGEAQAIHIMLIYNQPVIPPTMTSLEEYGLPREQYSVDDKIILYPHDCRPCENFQTYTTITNVHSSNRNVGLQSALSL